MINKDYNLYVHQEKVMIIITPMDIKGNIFFACKEDNLIIKNDKQDYLLMYVGKTNLDLLKSRKGLLVEVGDGRMVAEHEIEIS
jgi:hypothetical protein